MARYSQQLLLLVLLFAFVGKVPYARAEFSEDEPIHHFFNARLLAPGENQISIAGNYKRGITDDFEVGTQGAAILLMGALNFGLKHRMFSGDHWETAFVFHGARLETSAVAASASQDEEDESTETSTLTALIYASASGIVTTYDLAPNQFLNLGLYHFFMREAAQVDSTKIVTKLNVFSLAIGYDHYFTKNLAGTFSYCHSMWMLGGIESDEQDAEININTFSGLPPRLNPSIGFATVTFSGDILNLEGGLAFVALDPFIYGNVFWRFF